MPTERFEFRIPFSKLLIGLIFTIVPISIAGLYGVSQSRRSLSGVIGDHFSSIAASAAAETTQYIHERAIDVALLAADPILVDAVAASNRSYRGMSDKAITTKIEGIDKTWETASVEPLVKEILSSRASRALRRHLELDPRFLRITVTDAMGATVAATHKSADYYQADEDYWQNIYAKGKGATSLTDILHDEVTKADYVGVGVPVIEEGSNRFIGTVDALVDVASLSPIVNRSPSGSAGQLLLVKEDGTVISAPHVTYAMNVKSDDYAAVRDAMTRLPLMTGVSAGQQAGYTVADFGDTGRRLISYADTGLNRDYPNLRWMVLVSQNERQALAPVRFVERLIFYLSALALAMVALLAVYFASHRQLALDEIGEVGD